MAHIKLHSFISLFVTIFVAIALQYSKICSMKVLSVWAYESLENLPMILGFVIAARLWDVNLLAGFAILCLGMAFGVLVKRLVEPKLHNTKAVYYSPGRLGLSTLLTILLTLFASLIIALIDYQEMYL